MQSNQPHTFVVITLDPPIRKGQTLYPHIVIQVHPFELQVYNSIKYLLTVEIYFTTHHIFYRLVFILISTQFETEAVVERELTLSEEQLTSKYKDRLEPTYKVIYAYIFVYNIVNVSITRRNYL